MNNWFVTVILASILCIFIKGTSSKHHHHHQGSKHSHHHHGSSNPNHHGSSNHGPSNPNHHGSSNHGSATCVDGIQNGGESGIDCGGPCWSCDHLNNDVSCGGNSAPTCAQCGNSAGMCNGMCSWDSTKSVCFRPETEVFCRNDNDCIATESCKPESEHPRSDNSEDFIRKLTNETRNSMLKQAIEDYFELKSLSDRGGSEARWAESVHLDFSRDGFDRRKWKKVSKNGWMLENTIVVHKSVQNTFFMTVGYGQGGYAGIQQQPSWKCGKKEGFCGDLIFSMWDANGKHASIVRAGKDVHTEKFGGEGNGVKAMKFINWRPNEEIVTTVKGTWDARIQGYRVECTIKVGRTRHFMAEFKRSGEHGMLDEFMINSFVEDWDHNENADGCLYQRSAAFIEPKIHYNEAGKKKVVVLNKARFTGDIPRQKFCKDWSCANSGKNFFTMTTGGARQGKPDRKCHNGQILTFNAANDQDFKGPVKHCV